MAKIQKSTEVCDEWSQHALCPAGDTCGKLHGEETRSYVCDAYLYKGKCLYGRGRQTCRYSHPPQPSVTGTEYLRHLNLLQGRQIPLEQEIDDVSAISLETHRDVASYSWVKGTTDQIAIPGTLDSSAIVETLLTAFKDYRKRFLVPPGLRRSVRTSKTRPSTLHLKYTLRMAR